MAPPAISVCIATRDRADLLVPLLRSLAVAQAEAAVTSEVIVVDNGSSDATPGILANWAANTATHVHARCPAPGKSRALNQLLGLARAPLLAFTDDDVEVAPDWVQAIVDFCATHPEYDAAMGRVRIPPQLTDAGVRARVARYGTLPLFDAGDAVCDVNELYGCNMVLHRRVFDAVGGFDERLGPGASGWGEDTDLSERARRAGLRLGYMPDAVVYHAVDPTRLTAEFFRAYHRRKAQGDFEKDPARYSRKNLSRLVDASLRCAWCRLTGDADRGMRARMRMIRHAEILRLRARRRWRA